MAAQKRLPKRKPMPAVDSRGDILDTAARLFRAEGYAATSLRDIASACGLQAGSLYHHFSSKDEIVAEVLRIGVENVYRAVREAVISLDENAEPATVLLTAITAHLRTLLELQDYTSANIRIFGQVPEHVRAGHLPIRDEYERLWTTLLKRCSSKVVGGRRRNLRMVRFFLIGAMNGTLEWYHDGGSSLDSVARELTAVFMWGIHPAGVP